MTAIREMLEMKGGMNGLKTILGAALVVLAGQMDVLNDLIPLLPDYSEALQSIMAGVKGIMEVIEWLLKIAGNGLLSVGALHKVWKFVRNIF